MVAEKGGERKKLVSHHPDNKNDLVNKNLYGVENKVTYLEPKCISVKQTRAKDYDVMAGKKMGFDATSPRFHYNQVFHYSETQPQVGPGKYSAKNLHPDDREKEVPA